MAWNPADPIPDNENDWFLKRKHEGNKIIDDLVKYINQADSNAQNLWYILTALRGPDMVAPPGAGVYNEDAKKEKIKTTARLRARLGFLPHGFNVDFGEIEHADPAVTGVHFTSHIDAAISALEHFGRK